MSNQRLITLSAKTSFGLAILFVVSALQIGCEPAATAPGLSSNDAEPHDFYFPTTGVGVDREAVLFAIDNYLLPQRENLTVYLSKPSCRQEPVLTGDTDNPLAPDQVGTSFYGTVLNDDGKFRMWYYAMRLNEPGDAHRIDITNLLQGPVCYAESTDGIDWTKPSLGQVEIRGSKDNNAILLPDSSTQAAFVIKDLEDPDPQRRYKMVYNAHTSNRGDSGKPGAPETGTWVTRTATSPDGWQWEAAAEYATDQFIEGSSFYHFNGLYVVNGQRLLPSEGGHPGGRQGSAISSVRFDGKWLPGHTEAFLLPEPEDPAERGQTGRYAQVHLGVGGVSYGNVVVGLYGLWYNEPGDFNPEQRWSWFGYGKTSGDLGLVFSNDGLHFREPVKGHVFISRFDSPATPIEGENSPTILCQTGNAILNVGDETRIYFGRWRNAAYNQGLTVEVALATLPRDRWGAVGLYPKDAARDVYRDRGSIWSAPVRIPSAGCRVVLNADHTGLMSIEVSDAKFQLLPDYSAEQSGKLTEDSGLDCPITWQTKDLSALGGQTVRFKVNMRDGKDVSPRLYAVYLRSE